MPYSLLSYYPIQGFLSFPQIKSIFIELTLPYQIFSIMHCILLSNLEYPLTFNAKHFEVIKYLDFWLLFFIQNIISK